MERVRDPSEVERLQARRVQQNSKMQLLVKILQERNKADSAVEMGRGQADGMVEREDEQPLPGAPGTVLCRALFLVFLSYQRSAPRCAGGGPSWCYFLAASRVPPRSRRWP